MLTIEQQIEHELGLRERGIQKYRKDVAKHQDSGSDSKTLHGRAIIQMIIDPYIQAVKELQENTTNVSRDIAYKKIKDMDAEKIAYIALVTVVDAFSQHMRLIKVARFIGGNVELEARVQQWIDEDGKPAKKLVKKANEKASARHKKAGLIHKLNDLKKDTEWTEEERIHVGLRLIDKLIVSTGIISLEKITTGRQKTSTYIKLTEGTLDWIKKFNEYKEAMKPISAPCLIKPKPWTDVTGGGYHNDIMRPLSLVRKA